MTPQELRERTAALAVLIQKAVESLVSEAACRDAALQLIRSSTSAAANYRAAGHGRSRAEFLSKLGVALEEADETVFWLEHLAAIRPDAARQPLLEEARQLVLILGASKRTAKQNLEHLRTLPAGARQRDSRR